MKKGGTGKNEFKKVILLKRVISSKALPVAICSTIVFALCGIGWLPWFSLEDLIEVDVVASVGLVSVISWVIAFVERYISRRLEENLKLDPDYADHIARYRQEQVFAPNGKQYPLVELCGEIRSIDFHASEKRTYELPAIIVHYMTELMGAHKTSKFKNKPLFRVESLSVEDGRIHIEASPSDLYCTLLTNRVMDFEIHDNITVREVFEPGPKLHSFENAKLNNGLGFNFIARTTDGYYALVKRTGKNPTGKFKYSTYSSMLQPHFNPADDSYDSMVRQLSYNALMTVFNYPKTMPGYAYAYECIGQEDVEYLGMVRNLIEGGKPELAYVLQLHLSSEELENQFYHANNKDRKQRGATRLMLVKPEDYEIRENDRVYFAAWNREVQIPLIALYILEKLKEKERKQ